MKTRIFYTSNAGLYFCSEKSEVLVDGIHNAASVGFAPMTKEMVEQEKSKNGLFAGSGALLFTHLHKDHYDEDEVNEYLREHPGTALWGPGLENVGISVVENDQSYRFSFGDFRIIAYKTKHSGPRALDAAHCSLLIINEASDEAFFVAGDAVLEKELATEISREEGIVVFVMAYQLAEKKSKAFLEELKPSRIILIHQPRPEDDAYSKVNRILSFAIDETSNGIAVEKPEPMSWIE